MKTTGRSQAARFLLDVIDLLNELKIPYAAVGALAASFWGVPRTSEDADALIWLKRGRGGLQDLTDRLKAAGYKVTVSHGEMDDPVYCVVVVEDLHENRVDLLAGVRGMSSGAVRRCISTALMGSPIRMIGAEDFIAMKVFAGGPQDLIDVRRVLQVSGPRLNLDLLRRVAQGHGAATLREVEELLKKS